MDPKKWLQELEAEVPFTKRHLIPKKVVFDRAKVELFRAALEAEVRAGKVPPYVYTFFCETFAE